MIPYPYNMVDMGGIDLAEANGTVVDGLYAKIVEAVDACGDVVLYNWKFAGIEIAPQHTSILIGDPIVINGAVQVTEQDEVTVPGINPDPPEPPEPPIILPLEVDQNGIYNPPIGVAGYSPVTVDVSSGPSDVEYWDLSDSFIGTLRGIPSAAYNNVAIESTGANFPAYGAIRFDIGWDGMTIEIETGNFQQTSGSHRRFVMIGGANSGVGFIYRSSGKWAFYTEGYGWTETSETDGSFFDNCLVKIHIDSDRHWHIYKDGVLFWEPLQALSANYSYLVIGSTSGSITGTIKNVRVY